MYGIRPLGLAGRALAHLRCSVTRLSCVPLRLARSIDRAERVCRRVLLHLLLLRSLRLIRLRASPQPGVLFEMVRTDNRGSRGRVPVRCSLCVAREMSCEDRMDDRTFLICGGVYIDEKHTVHAYPLEDSTTRSLSVHRSRGGNAASTACVLAQCAPASRVCWMGAVPHGEDAHVREQVEFVFKDLQHHGVDTTHHEAVHSSADGAGSLGIPTATIILAQNTGSRTIVSSRRGLRELSPEHFSHSRPDPIVQPSMHASQNGFDVS